MTRATRIVLLSCLAACALPPPAADVELGRRVAESMAEEVGIHGDDRLGDYVEDIADRLAAQLDDTPFRYEFKVLDQPEPNAFAAPGGFVFVSRGLLALALSEDELAGVIGHEIIHVERRHSVRQLQQRTPAASLLALPGRVVGRVLSRDLGNILSAPFDAFGALRKARYSRGQEAESDELGQELAARAGYDPAALAAILGRMEAFAETLTGEAQASSFFDSHPATPDRVHEVEARAPQLSVAPRPAEALGPEAFLHRLDGLIWGPDPAQGEFRDGDFLHPLLDIAITFPAGWETVNTPRLAGATDPDGSAVILYGTSGLGGPEQVKRIAEERRQELEAEAGLRPDRDEVRELRGRSARLLVYTDRSGSEAVHMFFLWVAFGGRVHQLIGTAPESARDQVRTAVESLRSLTEGERQSFVVHRVRIVAARDGEDLAQLGRRTGNRLDLSTTAIVNGLSLDAGLRDGQLVKVVQQEPYRPRSD